MALDEPKNTDDVFEVNEFKFLVDKTFLKDAAPIKVDFGGFGFTITSNVETKQESGCSGCGTTSNCC